MTQRARKGHKWTGEKLDFLEKYLPAFQKITHRFEETYYVDGFAGNGHNLVGNQLRKGSALIALNLEKPFKKYFFVEAQKVEFTTLQGHVQQHPRGQQVHMVLGDFNQQVDGILRRIPPTKPCFYLLDPCGMELEWSTVEKIGRRTKADVLILISASGPLRNRDNPEMAERITRFYGHERWKEVDPALSEKERFRQYAELYLDGMEKLGFTRVDKYIEAQAPRNGRPGLHIHIIAFLSKHPTGHKLGNDVMKKLLREQHGQDALF